ncbi:MAG: type III-A CRISPR-associated RAMP protein Csm3 [Candidatus Diapherotrites archaeon]|nr:type III-A CRISPR-associated RAMP protein Csm3 [Candidatus Diapherotrites archaeon]
MRLVKIYKISGTITAKSGLRIGAERGEVAIGGIDNPVIRNPLTDEPYIPGSSIKGKMRSLMEWALGKVSAKQDKSNSAHQCDKVDCEICRVFGSAANQQLPERGPTRLIVRDAYLTEASREALVRMGQEKGQLYTEAKQEVFIPRLGGDANPRTTERVPAGAEFDFELVYKVYDLGDGGSLDERYFDEVVKRGLELLELDALGGHTSRGYGKVAIDYKVEEIDLASAG